jgi:hypothetical protein
VPTGTVKFYRDNRAGDSTSTRDGQRPDTMMDTLRGLSRTLARQKFIEEALERYRTWAAGLGALPHKISADLAILRSAFFPSPEQRRVHDRRLPVLRETMA